MAYLILSERLGKLEIYKTQSLAESHLRMFLSVDANAVMMPIPSELLTVNFWRRCKGLEEISPAC